MKRIWLVAVLTMKDCVRSKFWVPLPIGLLLAFFALLLGFGYRMNTNIYANNIMSNFFEFVSLGIYSSGLFLGVASMPAERRAAVMFTLPISRLEIAIGKVLGLQMVMAAALSVAYGVSLALASYFGLTHFTHSLLAFATALALSFVYLCLSVPLGFWLSPVTAAVVVWLVVDLPWFLQRLAEASFIRREWLVRVIDVVSRVAPGQIKMEAISRTFYAIRIFPSDFYSLAPPMLLSLLFFMVLSMLARNRELSTKS